MNCFEDFVCVLQIIFLTKKSILVQGLHTKNRKYTRDIANIGNPKVNKGCSQLTVNRNSADCDENSLGPSIQYIPLSVYQTGGFNAMYAANDLTKTKNNILSRCACVLIYSYSAMNKPYIPWELHTIYYLQRTANVMFSPLYFFFMFVCVSTISRENGWPEFHENFQDGLGMIQGIGWQMRGVGVMFNPWIQGFFFCVFKEMCVCFQHYKNTFSQIFMKFSATVGHENRTNQKPFWDDAVKPLNPGSILLFPGSILVSDILENGWTGFHEIFM